MSSLCCLRKQELHVKHQFIAGKESVVDVRLEL